MTNESVPNVEPEQLYSLPHAAARYDVTTSFLRKKIAVGELRAVKVGGAVRIPAAALIGLAAPRSVGTGRRIPPPKAETEPVRRRSTRRVR